MEKIRNKLYDELYWKLQSKFKNELWPLLNSEELRNKLRDELYIELDIELNFELNGELSNNI